MAPAHCNSGRSTLPGYVECSEDVETLIFLDVDGVLNIGVRDPGNSALLLNDTNLSYVKKVSKSLHLLPTPVRNNVTRMQAALNKPLTQGDGTYADFACYGGSEVADELVRRLVTIMRAAGNKAQVILASTWRRPQYQQRVSKLEAKMSDYLNERFTFDQRTRLCTEHGGLDRLRTIGDHMEMLGKKRDLSQPLRVLVLDDFCITGFEEGKMDVDKELIRSPDAAATYLCRRYAPMAKTVPMHCAVIHTYDEWVAQGITVQLGCGLTTEHVCAAARFLSQEWHACAYEEKELISPQISRLPSADQCVHSAHGVVEKLRVLWRSLQ